MTAAEREERDVLLRAALSRVNETLERLQNLPAQGHEVAAIGLLKDVDLLLARLNLALAQHKQATDTGRTRSTLGTRR